MPVKVLLFGDNPNILKLLAFVKGDKPPSDDDIQVDNVKVQGKPFLLFTIKQNNLVASQAAGVGALIYFLSSNGSIQEARNSLIQLLSEAKELDGVPLVIALESVGRTINIKEVISELELFKIKERANMIKEIDYSAPSSINEIFEWVESQALRSSQLFDAQPRVVKAKPKYRQDTHPSEKTYENLMKDKKFKGLSSVDQQHKYLKLEKDRIKEQSMETQLSNFNRNKKKMSPYQIKPSPNPRIEPNLDFFLKDAQNQKPQQNNIKVQTDEFKIRPPSAKYIPKKTGVDRSTQVEDNELFDFDREVEPILNVLITKTLQLSSLEIEEEQEMLKMTKYKELYNDKRGKEKQHDKEQLKAEQDRIAAKDQLLKKHRQKQTVKMHCFQKVQAYNLSGAFVERLYRNCAQKLHSSGFFPNTFENELQTNYTDFLIKGTVASLENLKKRQTELDGLFDKQCVDVLLSASKKPHEEIALLKSKAQKRRTNYEGNWRAISVFYDHKPIFISNFARYFSKFTDKSLDEYVKNTSQKMKELQSKLAQGQITDEVLTKAKADDLAELTKNSQGMLILNPVVGFTIAHNEFENVPQKSKKLQIFSLCLDKNGQVLEKFSGGQVEPSKYGQYLSKIRDAKKPVNMDEGIVFDLNRIRADVHSIILFVKIPDLATLIKPESQALLKYSTYGIEFFEHSVPIHKQLLSTIKLEELYKPPENPDQPNQPLQSSLLFGYLICQRPEFGGWYLETLNTTTKGMTDEQQSNFIAETINYLKSSIVSDKQEIGEEEEEPEAPPDSASLRKSRDEALKDKKKKSAKLMEQPQIVRKTQLASRCMDIMILPFDDDLTIDKLVSEVESQFPNFISSCPFGWEFKIKGKQLEHVTQLKSFKKVGDLVIERKAEVIVENPIEDKGLQEGSRGQEELKPEQ